MQLISLAQASRQARTAIARFPLVLLAGFVAAGIALALIPRHGEHPDHVRALLAAALGLSLGMAVDTTRERRRWHGRTGWLIRLLAVAALLGIYFASRGWTTKMLAIHTIQLAVTFHLLVAVLPFGGDAGERGFWQFNRTLLQRFLITTFYTGVLFVALALALAALDKLFGVDVEGEDYLRLLALLGFVFHPWFFLGGIPLDLDALEASEDYPGAMKVFAQFILIPVVTLYLTILTVYLGRVLVTRTWPSGWIGYLVTSVAVAGTFALLLVHPIRERADSRWVNVYGRWFYVALLPSIGMLLVAIYQRVHQYGLTESRYFLAVIAFWLAGIALYYSVSRSHRIRLIPVTLCLVALATLVGPWSAAAVARRSQAGRLRALLVRNHLLAGGQIQRATQPLPSEEHREIRGAVLYLIDTHGKDALAKVSSDLRAAAAGDQAHAATQSVLTALGLEEIETVDNILYDVQEMHVPRIVTGYDYLVHANLLEPFTIPTGEDSIAFTFSKTPPTLRVARRGQIQLEVNLDPLIEAARRHAGGSRARRCPGASRGTATAPLGGGRRRNPPPALGHQLERATHSRGTSS